MFPRYLPLIGLSAFTLILAVASAAEVSSPALKTGEPALVPWPTSLTVDSGAMTLSLATRIVAQDEKLAPLAKVLADEIFLTTGLRLQTATDTAKPGDISLATDPALTNEAAAITVAAQAGITGADYNGVAMGTVSLLQAIKVEGSKVSIPHLKIEDKPKFKYRGAMLDVARKPHTIETLKACVEAARMYKVRYFHLHMTDENAWTFPSTKYPQLGDHSTVWPTGEKQHVYTVAELKDLVAFADARGVTMVPELELYGHSGQMRASMPEVFNYKQADGTIAGAGVINIANERSYEVLEQLIAEAADIFKSSPYINVGCDEASPDGTENFPEVKALVEREKLPYPHAIFNHHISKLNTIVKKYGKQMIVWEGAPIEPTPPPKDVIFLPWVGDSGYAAKLVAEGYPVINAPWGVKKLYMDPYEVNGAQLDRNTDKLIGATAIQWQMGEELALPFMRYNASLRNEPTHNPDSGKDLDDFILREARVDPLLDRMVHGFTLKPDGLVSPVVLGRLDPMFTNKCTLTLATSLKFGSLHYTLDGSEPTEKSPQYTQPIEMKQSTVVRAKWIGGREGLLYPFSRHYRKTTQFTHDAIGAAVTFTPARAGYPGPGPQALTDGMLSGGDSYTDPGWLGWNGQPVQITLDLGKPKKISTLGPRSIRGDGGLQLAEKMDFSASNDGEKFESVGTVTQAECLKQHGWYTLQLKQPITARYVRINTSPGQEWIFIDEIMVNGKAPGPNFKDAAIGKPVTFNIPPQAPYTGTGPDSITDGYVTNTAACQQMEWFGWEGKTVEATIDMGKPTDLKEVGGRFLQHVFFGVYTPTELHVQVSNDNKEFKEVGKAESPRDKSSEKIEAISAKLKGVKARYVKIVIPDNGVWMFCDELFVNPE